MPIVPIRGLGSGGIVKDTAAVLLEPNVFSDGRNVKFDDGSVRKRLGHAQIFNDLTGATNPHFGIHWPRPTTRYNIYANANTVYRVDQAGQMSNISTGSTYSTGARWQGSLFTGGYAVVMNNTVDTPQYILHGETGATFETTLTNLPNWNYTPSLTITAGVVRPYRNFLVAGNITTEDISNVITSNPGTIRISSAAAPGQVPSNWQPGTLGQRDSADELELSQTEPIVEMSDLRGQLFVYTGDSIHSVSIGSNFTNVSDYAYGYGCLAVDCVAQFDGNHFVVDRNDIYIHAGSGQIQSVVDGKLRRYFFENLHQTDFENTFVSVNRSQDEIWVCFPNLSSTNGDCNEALVWNYRDNHWTIYDIPNVRAGFQGPMLRNNMFQIAEEKLILVGRADSRFYAMDEGNTFNGDNFLAYVERKRTVAQQDSSSKWLGQFYPIFDAETSSTAITISLRGQNTFVQDVDFTDRTVDVNIFNPQDTDRGYKIDPRTNGRLINYRVESNDSDTWVLSGISVMVEEDDRR